MGLPSRRIFVKRKVCDFGTVYGTQKAYNKSRQKVSENRAVIWMIRQYLFWRISYILCKVAFKNHNIFCFWGLT